MTTKTTHERLFDFIAVAQVWIMKDPDNMDNKLGHAIQRTCDRLKKPQQKYHDRREEITIDHCLTDEKGRILRSGNDREGWNYEFDKQGLKERNAKLRELMVAEFEFEAYICKDLPMKDGKINLTFAEQQAFDGFVMHAREYAEPIDDATTEQQPVVQ